MTIDIAPRQPADLNGKVAEEIRVAMLRRRVSGRQLAAALEVSPTWVSFRLTGQQAIGLDDLERIAGVLNMRVGDLLPPEVRAVTGAYPPPVVTGGRPPAGPGGAPGRPADRRPPGHPGGRPPATPGRTGRVVQPVSA